MVVYLDRPKRVLVTVFTGWSEIVRGELEVKSVGANVKFDYTNVVGRFSSDGMVWVLLCSFSRCRIGNIKKGKNLVLESREGFSSQLFNTIYPGNRSIYPRRISRLVSR